MALFIKFYFYFFLSFVFKREKQFLHDASIRNTQNSFSGYSDFKVCILPVSSYNISLRTSDLLETSFIL